MALSGGPDRVPGGAARQKAETGTPAGIQSCRKAGQRAAPPEETRGDHTTVSVARWVLCSRLTLYFKHGEREERPQNGAGTIYATLAV